MLRALEPVQVIVVLGYLVPLLVAAGYDLKEFRIPNRLVLCYGVITALCIVGLYDPTIWWRHFLAGVITFAVGVLLFRFRWLGGGDIKLLAVVGLWLSLDGLPIFIYVLCIMGGVICVILFLLRKCLSVGFGWAGDLSVTHLPTVLQIGERIPYAVPIAITAICTIPLIATP